MQITNAFEVPLPVEESWRVLLDVPSIAPCMPGAQLTEILDDGAYAGNVAVRLGPIGLSFKGRARMVEADAAEHRARVRAEGADTKGRGRAAADVLFRLCPASAGTRVEVTTDLTLSGAVAQYARGAGMINDLANHLIGQFAANLRRKLEGETPSGPTPAQRGPERDAAAVGQPARSAGDPAAPIHAGSLGVRLLWRALVRAVGRLFGRSG